MVATEASRDAWLGSECRAMRCSSDKRAFNARRADGPVPPGAGGSPRMTLLASLDGHSSPPVVGRLVLRGRRHARGHALLAGRLLSPHPLVSLMSPPE